MATARSAALLVVRQDADAGPLLLLGHMGGPFWARKDAGAWSIPKGGHTADEPADVAARRELEEETGYVWPADTPLVDLGEFAQSRKSVRVLLGVEHEPAEPDASPRWDLADFRSNTFDLEWPPRSGVVRSFPELDRVGWFATQRARTLVVKGQVAAIDAAVRHLGGETTDPDVARCSAADATGQDR